MPGSRSTANGATTRRAASGGTSGPRGMSSAKTTAVTAVSTPLSSEREAHAAEVDGERQQGRGHQPAEGDGHLPHAEREPAPLRREAVEDRDSRRRRRRARLRRRSRRARCRARPDS